MQIQSQKLYSRLDLMQTLRQACGEYDAISDRCFGPLGLTGLEGELLLYLLRNPSQVTEKLSVPMSQSKLESTLKSLKQKGYIHYSIRKDQGRQVSLTIRAIELQDRLLEQTKILEDTVYSHLSDTEQHQTKQTLRRLRENMAFSASEVSRKHS